MSSICIIPARGGSKRIPRKNIKEFCGKPIIAYSIEAALNSNIFSEVMVSTDDYEIASIAREYGANVPFMRSAKASDDHATTMDVLEEVLKRYTEIEKEFDSLCYIYPCAPFVTAQRLQEANKTLINDNNIKAVLPVVAYSYPVQRSFEIIDGGLEMLFPENMLTRSQDLGAVYHDSGQFCFMNTNTVGGDYHLFGKYTRAIVLTELEVQDIDTFEDWKMAEIKYKLFTSTLT